MIANRDFVIISSIEWDFLWQGHQEIASRLAQSGNRVLYIENTGVRSPELRDAGRVASRLKFWTRSWPSGGVRQVAPNLYVCAPVVMPPFGSSWQRRLNRQLLLPLIRNATRKLKLRDPVILTYLPTDTASDLIQLLRTPRSVVVYYCIADFSQLTPRARLLKKSEAEVVKASDLVFAQNAELAAHCAQWTDEQAHIFPFGVNLDRFPARHDAVHVPAPDRDRSGPKAAGDLKFPRPVIGYVGGLHRHVDFDLLEAMARARPEWSWVFVGPLQTSIGELRKLPNTHFLGQQPHDAIAGYINFFDICIVPYVNDTYTDTVVPTKINEYLAMGKPVVSTNLPFVRDFNRRHNVLFTSLSDPQSFLQTVEQALHHADDDETVKRRREVAALHNWESRLDAMSELIASKSG
ncbi:MAG TPA: glycosyltransferase [Pyrinomonadaceae bacterium]|nr:glycosyltransferase [Pyrinomonadaceae bacterium]